MTQHKARLKIWGTATIVLNDKGEPIEIVELQDISDFEIIDLIT